MLKRLRNIFHISTSENILASKISNFKHLYKEQSPLTEWKLIKELGDGAFGKVYQAYHEEKKQYAAVKVIEDCTEEELPEHLVEVDILTHCQQKNIIELYDTYLDGKRLYIFLEYCIYGAVDHLISTLEHGLDEKQICFIAFQVLQALDYLHTEQFVIHRDVKASNILLTQTGQVKLADFGVSAKNSSIDEKRNEYIGTVYWMAPEVFFCEANTDMTYDYRVDIWSFGITLIELAEMDPPHHEMRADRVGAKIRQAIPPTLKNPRQWSDEFVDILTCCLKRDPTERKTCRELKQHSFFNNAETFHSSILYLLEEYKTIPVVEVVDDESIPTPPPPPSKSTTSVDSGREISPPMSHVLSDEDGQNKNHNSMEDLSSQSSTIKENDDDDDDDEKEKKNEVLNDSSIMSIPKAPPFPSSNSTTPVILTTQFPSVTRSEPTTLPPLPPTTNGSRRGARHIIVERQTSRMEKQAADTSTVRIQANIEIGRLQMKDLAERELDRLCEQHYQDLLEEVIQSDTDKPSIPEVILAVITELTNDEDEFDRNSIDCFNQNQTELYYPTTTSSLRSDQSLLSTSDETRATRRRTIRTTRRFIGPDGKPAEIITTKIVEPYDNNQFRFNERKEAHREFRRLYHLEEKRRQQLLKHHEYEISEQQAEFHRKREQLIEQNEFELRTLDEKYQLKREREEYHFSKPQRFQTTKDDEFSRHVTQQTLEQEYQQHRQILIRNQERFLYELDQQELHSRYELLRKQTKTFYALFRTMLTQQFEKEFQQLDQQIQFERNTLQAQLDHYQRECLKTRNQQFRQQITPERNFLKQVSIPHRDDFMFNNENEQLFENLNNQHELARQDLMLIQKQKLEQCAEYETQKLQELQITFENDWIEFTRIRQLSRIISLPHSNAIFHRIRPSPKMISFPMSTSRAPVILRSTGSMRLQTWHSWPGVDSIDDQQFRSLSNTSESILF